MTAIISFLWSKAGGYVMAALAILGLLFGVYRSGKKSARVDSMEKQLENVKVRQDVEKEVSSSPVGSSAQRLRNEWARD